MRDLVDARLVTLAMQAFLFLPFSLPQLFRMQAARFLPLSLLHFPPGLGLGLGCGWTVGCGCVTS